MILVDSFFFGNPNHSSLNQRASNSFSDSIHLNIKSNVLFSFWDSTRASVDIWNYGVPKSAVII